MTEKAKKSSFLQNFLLGGVSAGFAKTMVAPLERVRILLQTEVENLKLHNKMYKGPMDCFSRCLKEDGFLAFWRSNWTNVLRYIPTQAVGLGVNDKLKEIFITPYKKNYLNYFVGSLVCGGLAGSIAYFCNYPLDFIRVRLASDLGKPLKDREFKGMTDCFIQIYNKDGVPGIYRGVGLTLVAAFVLRSIYFGGYELAKNRFSADTTLKRWVVAQIVTTIAEVSAYPFDTIRKRMMMQAGRAEKESLPKTIPYISESLKKAGVSGLYK